MARPPLVGSLRRGTSFLRGHLNRWPFLWAVQMDNKWWVIVASGPSLTRSDCDALRGVGRAVAVNCAVFFAPWVDVLYASDGGWYRHFESKIEWFKGKRISRSCKSPTIERYLNKAWPRTGGNSGHVAIQYAVDNGATQVALIGFDHQKTDGKSHFHGDYPSFEQARRVFSNASGIAGWPGAMADTANDLKQRGVRVVNLSRETALTCFPRMTVEEFLCQSA